MRVSIITPTIRKDGLQMVLEALSLQTFTDWEWIIGSSFDPEIKAARWVKDDFTGGVWSLNRIYNRLFKESKGDIIVTWQDYIWAAPDALQKFVTSVESTNGFVSGVGDQYFKPGMYGKPIVKIWDDPRKTDKYGSFYEVNPNDIEWNFAAFPKKCIEELGGMDEQLDFLGFGGDQLQVMERAGDAGMHCFLDQTNESYTLRHGRVKDWDEKHVLFAKDGDVSIYDKRKEELKQKGLWPTLHFLSNGVE